MNDALHVCAESGNLEGVRRLVEGGANIDETNGYGETALSLAVVYGHFEIVVYPLRLTMEVTLPFWWQLAKFVNRLWSNGS
jgi:ankyrin repeat protein